MRRLPERALLFQGRIFARSNLHLRMQQLL